MDTVIVFTIPRVPAYIICHMKSQLGIVLPQQILMHLRTDSAIDIHNDVRFKQMNFAT